jgi:hypothetical protein
MVFNLTFNNISVISWQSVLLVEETLKILRRSEVTINLTRRLKKLGASEFAPL